MPMPDVIPTGEAATPTVLPPPPRSVRLRKGSSKVGVWGVRLFILPHQLIGIGALVALGFFILAVLLGSDVTARVSSVSQSRTVKHGTTSYADFTYEADGVT